MNQMKVNITLVVTLLCIWSTVSGQNYPASDVDNTGGWTLNEKVSDEFNGTALDKTKWWILGENGDYRSKWKGRAPGQFVAHNVKVEGGNLVLTSQWEPNFTFLNETNEGIYYGGTSESADKSKPITQSCIMSETFFKYGYMEIRCKAADAPVTSGFWTTGYHGEIDMIENFGKLATGNPENKSETLEKLYRTNLINWDPDKAVDHEDWKVEDEMNERVASDFFVYGFEWDPNYIKTFFNGKLIQHATRAELEAKDQWKYQYPHELWLSSEVFYWYGLPSAADLVAPGEFQIDYIRIWQKEITGPEYNALGFEGPFYYQGRSVFWWSAQNAYWRIKDEKVACGSMAARFKHSGSFTGSYSIFAPYGSLDLPAGDNEINFQIWLDPKTTVSKLDIILQNPWMKFSVDLTNVKKGEWVELTQAFTRSQKSDISLVNGDRLQFSISASDISGSEALLYIDDISFRNSSTAEVKCVIDILPEPDDDLVTSIDDIRDVDFSIYPNPASGMLTISSIENGLIEIFNITGILKKSVKINAGDEEIEIGVLPAGTYLLRFSTAQKKSTRKVIIE